MPSTNSSKKKKKRKELEKKERGITTSKRGKEYFPLT